MEAATLTPVATPLDPHTLALSQRRRDGIAWVETEGVSILRDFAKTIPQGFGGRDRFDTYGWVGLKRDPRNLLLEAYEALHPIA